MIKAGQGLTWTFVMLGVLLLGTSGCASKKYVNNQVNSVNQRLALYEKQTNDRLAWLNNKQQSDIAQVNDRMAVTDQKLAKVAQVANAAQAQIAQINQTNMASRSTEEAEIAEAANSAVASALNYQLVAKADVTFGFAKADLTQSARTVLDEVVTKFQSSPRAVIELAGFTDPIGSSNYNLALSRRRAWAVQRYLVDHNVPLRSIHVVGMGEETGPARLAPQTPPADGTERDEHRRLRRVNIRVYGAGEIAGATGS